MAVSVMVCFYNSIFLLFSLSVCLFVRLMVFVDIAIFYISPNTEAVRSRGLSMIKVNLWKTYFAND